jgi:hypothetical protein
MTRRWFGVDVPYDGAASERYFVESNWACRLEYFDQ